MHKVNGNQLCWIDSIESILRYIRSRIRTRNPSLPLYAHIPTSLQLKKKNPLLILSNTAFWYTRHEMGTRMAYWFGFAAVAGAFGGLIAFGIQSIPSSHILIANWRLLFIVEGIPTVLMGVICMVWLPDRPEVEKRFLREEERVIQKERMGRGTRADVGRVVYRSK